MPTGGAERTEVVSQERSILAEILEQAPTSQRDEITRAYRFAEAAHAEHTRDEGTPFIEHPLRVASILVAELGCCDLDLITAAFNHDVLEDCPAITMAQLTEVIGRRACAMVVDVTKLQVPSEEKAARDRAYLDRLPGLPWESRLLKLADRIDNLRSVPASGDAAKARRYLEVSLAEFVPLAATTSPAAERLVLQACDRIRDYLADVAPH